MLMILGDCVTQQGVPFQHVFYHLATRTYSIYACQLASGGGHLPLHWKTSKMESEQNQNGFTD
jgi:hypothetical protein